MYRFVTLTDEEVQQRRVLLDWYANLAQVSVLIPVLAVQGYFLAEWATQKWAGRSDGASPRSPHLKDLRPRGWLAVGELRLHWRRFAWWCGDSIDVLGWHVGTRGEVLAAGGWMAWLLCLCFLQTGDDYLHFTKRFGIVGASQLPVHYLLSVKSPYSPLQILTRRSHETLISIHQLLGRILTTMLGLHALCYLNFYILSGLLGAKLQQAYVLCGLFGILSLTTMGITALAPVRRRNYRVFHMVHVALATAIIPVLYFHVTYIRLYLFEIVVVHALNVLLRFLRTTTLSGEIKLVSGTSLVDISIPTLPSGEKGGNFASWQPGQHAYISLPSHPLLRTFRSNPFSVASVPSMDKRLRFVARILDGNTAKLARSPAPTQKLKIEGPYGAVFHAERMLHYDRVLFVAGGVGATFIVPLYRQLLADLSPGKGSQRRRNVSFLWTARSMADVTWALPEDDKEREGFVERLRVCVTQAIGDAQVSNSAAPDFGHEDEIPLTSREDGIELEEQKTLLADDGDERPEKSVTGSGLTVHAGRPDLARTVEQVFSHNGTERVAVLVCGPRGLSQRLRKEVGRFVRQGREVWFWEECFAL